ncbi:MAG: HdeD family acid-resistance protein [Sarcina sp.]
MKFVCILEGILLAIIGLVFLFHPVTSLLSIALLVGILFIVYGIAKFIRLWKEDNKILHIIMCIIDVLFGLIIIFAPISTAAELIWILGIWALIRGIYYLIFVIQSHQGGFNFPTLYSILIIIWGLVIIFCPIVILAFLPLIVCILGIYFIFVAICEIILGFKLSK